MDRLHVEPDFAASLRASDVATCADLIARFAPEDDAPEPWDNRGLRVLIREGSLQSPTGADPVAVHCKIYQHRRPTWRFLLRRSKARIEHRNLGAMRDIGLPTPRRVAWAELRTPLGRLRAACIVTTTLEGVVPLDQCLAADPPVSLKRRRALVERVAGQARLAHSANFFHHDLFPRNILVPPSATADAQPHWIDSPRGRYDRTPLRRRRLIKDLACLNKHARRLCTRSERLRFLLSYLKRDRVDHEVRDLAARVNRYTERRWKLPSPR